MKTLLIAVVAYSFSFIPVSGDSVYICVSPSAKKYHFLSLVTDFKDVLIQ